MTHTRTATHSCHVNRVLRMEKLFQEEVEKKETNKQTAEAFTFAALIPGTKSVTVI